MTDVKFMDISENNNPATTDSILIANTENGVKRTTLGTLNKMFAVKGLFHLEKIQTKLQAHTVSYHITAPNIAGYKFAFWLSPYTEGASFSSYINNPANSDVSIFVTTPKDIQPTDIQGDQYFPTPFVTAQAVYIKADLA